MTSMDDIFNYLRPFLARVIAGWIAAAAVYLQARFHILVDDQAQTQLVAGALSILFGVGSTVYAIVHKYIDKRINPGDAASSHLAVTSMAVAAKVKARDS